MVLDGRNINFSKVKLANSYNIPSQPSLGPSYPINSKATIPRSEATNGNLQQFFVSSLELARHIFQAAAAHIFCSEDAEFNFQIGLGWELPRLDRDFYLYQATLTQDAVLWLEDMATEAKICLDDVLHKWGIRFWAGIPLTNSRGKKVGILCVFDTQPHQFNVDHQRLLLCLKVQIELQFKLNHEVLSVHKALEELETQNRYLNLLEQLSASLSGCATQKEICQVISCQISQLFPNSYGYIQLFKQPEQELQELLQWGKSYQETDHDFDAYPLLIEQKLLGNIYFCPNYFIDRAPYGDEVLSKFLEQVSRALYNVALFQALQLQSIKDPLTGLFNRRYMTEVLEQLIQTTYAGNSVGIMMLDLDYFKQINDRFGHQAGDAVLKDFSVFIKGIIRPTDIACRYGGEEFALILPRTSLAVVQQRAERICRGLRYLTMHHGQVRIGHISVSIGVAIFPDHGATVDAVLKAADQALYVAKAGGRDRVVTAGNDQAKGT